MQTRKIFALPSVCLTYALISGRGLKILPLHRPAAYTRAKNPHTALAVVSLSTEELVVRGAEGGPDVAFDYIVNGLRIGFEESSVIRPKEMEAWIFSMAANEEIYTQQPELRQYNALERFKAMRPATQGKTVALTLSRANALRDAITVFDPAIHQMPHPPRPGETAIAAQSTVPSTEAENATSSTTQPTSSQNNEVQELRARVAALEKLVAQLALVQSGAGTSVK